MINSGNEMQRYINQQHMQSYESNKRMQDHIDQHTDKPRSFSKPSSRRNDVEEQGSVRTCFSCGYAYFSHLRPYVRPTSSQSLECEGCVNERVFLTNMKLLKAQGL